MAIILNILKADYVKAEPIELRCVVYIVVIECNTYL